MMFSGNFGCTRFDRFNKNLNVLLLFRENVCSILSAYLLFKAPFCPPKPIPPEVCLAPSSYEENMKTLWMRPVHTDVNLIAGNCSFSAHRCLLAAASPAFHRLFLMELVQELTPRSSSESSMVNFYVSFNSFYFVNFQCLSRNSFGDFTFFSSRSALSGKPRLAILMTTPSASYETINLNLQSKFVLDCKRIRGNPNRFFHWSIFCFV